MPSLSFSITHFQIRTLTILLFFATKPWFYCAANGPSVTDTSNHEYSKGTVYLITAVQEQPDDTVRNSKYIVSQAQTTVTGDSLTSTLPSDTLQAPSRLKSQAKADYEAGMQNALKYFDPTYAGQPMAVLTALCWPAGLVTALISDRKFPNEERMLTNDYEQFHNLNFKRGYQAKARQMKKKHIWNGFLTGTAFDIFVIMSVGFTR